METNLKGYQWVRVEKYTDRILSRHHTWARAIAQGEIVKRIKNGKILNPVK